VVLASEHEETPKASSKAIASGRPLINMAGGDAALYVEHGANGWLVASPQPASIRRSLEALACTPDEPAAIGRKGRLRLEEMVSTSRPMVQRHEGLYKRVMDGAR
jgi:glycosyltransferase involved in cell wall biosynthesis